MIYLLFYFVRYAYYKNLDYFSTECIYSPNAYRGHARKYIKDLEKIRSSAILGNSIFCIIAKYCYDLVYHKNIN